MNHSFIFDETTLRRIPHFLVLMLVLLLGLPYIGINFGLDFGVIANKLGHTNVFNSQLIEPQIRGYFRQTLLQWSGFSIAAVTILLSFTQYRLSNDKIALIIGLSVLFSGSVQALHTLVIDGLSIAFSEKNNLDALVWTFSSSLSGLIIIFGLSSLLVRKEREHLSFMGFILLATFLVLCSIALIYYAASVIILPQMWFKNYLFSRPYEATTIVIYLFLILVIYPRAYKAYPFILTNSIFYMGVTEIVISVYLMFLSTAPYDSAYNAAYFLKIIEYSIPCTCLVINYVFSYSAVLSAQKRLKIKQEELSFIAAHDSLTNLFNRRKFEELLDKAIANSTRLKSSLALLLIDLDNFKSTNDTFGHVHGDELLRQFSRRLNLLIRKGDILCRVGGDEFTLITPNISSPTAARQLAERILNERNIPYTLEGKLITASVSIGISISPIDGQSTKDLLRKADMAMYKAKSTGKNNYQFYTEQLSFLQHRESEVETHLKKALENDELELLYQPQFNLITQEIIGAEILLHWNNATLGNVTPTEFIPVAERTGLIIDLGQWVIRKTFEQVMARSKSTKKLLKYSINISPIQLSNHLFLKNLKDTLIDFNFPASHLELEITENLLMGNSEEVHQALESISALGIKLSLDDFGKEYSSLNRLNTLPINTLKIDKSFVSDIHDVNKKVVIIDIIIKLAYELGMNIVAEGIETREQLNYLISRKCYIGQGFLFSKPMKNEAFFKLAYKPQGNKRVIKKKE
jgi:diguanylate cyclase (GGDEF)-like protein